MMPTTEEQVTLWLTEQGARVHRIRNRFLVRKGNDTLQEVPVELLEGVVICGNVILTPGARNSLLKRGVETVFLSHLGQYKGRLESRRGNNVALRSRQYECRGNTPLRLRISRQIVAAKLHNQRVLLARRRDASEIIRHCCEELERHEQKSRVATKVASLRGLEGSGAGAYFKGLAAALKDPMDFSKRTRRPPTDPVNAMLSLGYTLLYEGAVGALRLAGLDPWAGFYHEARPGHAALASDLVEEFRAPVVGALVLGLVNRRTLTTSDFRRTRSGGYRLKQPKLKRYLEAYARRIRQKTIHPATGERFPLLRCMEVSARQLAAVLRGERDSYNAFEMR